jgi:hypothetical protein
MCRLTCSGGEVAAGKGGEEPVAAEADSGKAKDEADPAGMRKREWQKSC